MKNSTTNAPKQRAILKPLLIIAVMVSMLYFIASHATTENRNTDHDNLRQATLIALKGSDLSWQDKGLLLEKGQSVTLLLSDNSNDDAETLIRPGIALMQSHKGLVMLTMHPCTLEQLNAQRDALSSTSCSVSVLSLPRS